MHINLFDFQQHKIVWRRIASAINNKGYNITAEHCINKWKGLKKRYKSIKNNNNKSGAGRQFWIHYDAIDNILKDHPEIAPLSLASSTKGFRIFNTDSDENEIVEDTSNFNDAEILSHNNKETYRISKTSKTRKRNEPYWAAQLRLQRERYHKENFAQKERFLSLMEKQSNLNYFS